MTNTAAPPFSAADIASWLQQNPSFFDDHATLFATLKVPHPQNGTAISLGERQLLALRERIQALEHRIALLSNTARTNQHIATRLHAWSLVLLAEPNAANLPGHVTNGLKTVFNVPAVALRLWPAGANAQPPVSRDILAFAEGLHQPYCGRDTKLAVAAWLPEPPASLAIVALRPRNAAPPFGLLVLGGDDETRFTADMGTIFLEQVGLLAGAALSRLHPQPAAATTP